jgi:hypothetical protein
MKMRSLKAGDWVEVLSQEEILKTLDSHGRLDGMPFMPEMFAFCGQRLRVYKRAHKTCDTVFPVRSRRVHRAVHLETRCDGAAHGGCQAECLIFWKEAWLKPVDKPGTMAQAPLFGIGGATDAMVWANTKREHLNAPPRYVCQATQLPYATADLNPWDLRQYVEDYTSGNVGLWRIFCGFVYVTYYNLSQAGIGMGRPMRWFYDRVRFLWRGSLFPRKAGAIPAGQRTPAGILNLQPGQLVRVKSHEEILRTLDTNSRNRGIFWDAEMVPYCGRTYRVLRRVSKIVNEKTGELQDLKNPCIILDTVVCQSRYSNCRMFCPRSIYPYWREVWLERLGPTPSDTNRDGTPVTVCAPM